MKAIPVNKSELTAIWNHADELITSMKELDDEELVICRKSLLERAEEIRDLASSYVSDADVAEMEAENV